MLNEGQEQEEAGTVEDKDDIDGLPFDHDLFCECAVQVGQDAPVAQALTDAEMGMEGKDDEEEADHEDIEEIPPTVKQMRNTMRTIKKGPQT